MRPISPVLQRERKDGERATQLREVAQLLVAADSPQPLLVLLETRSHADAGPATDPREHTHVLPALVLVGEDVADDPRRRLELEQLLVHVVRVDAFQVAFERAVAG